MVDHRKNPTNADIIHRLDDMQAILNNQGHILEGTVKDIDDLKTWQKIEIASRKAAKEAVEEYRHSESSRSKPESKINAELLKNLGVALAIISTLIIAIIEGKGGGL